MSHVIPFRHHHPTRKAARNASVAAVEAARGAVMAVGLGVFIIGACVALAGLYAVTRAGWLGRED